MGEEEGDEDADSESKFPQRTPVAKSRKSLSLQSHRGDVYGAVDSIPRRNESAREVLGRVESCAFERS